MTPTPKSPREMDTDELRFELELVRYQHEKFRLGLLKTHGSFWVLVIALLITERSNFLGGKYFVATVAIVTVGLLTNLAFVYRRDVKFKVQAREIKAEFDARQKAN